jgi:galactose mutarotase-like enzyme
MRTIENEYLKIVIKEKGAELESIFNKQTQLEYMWNADPAFWGKKSPVLFPVVGALKNDTYFFENNGYSLSRHGFARESEFIVTEQAGTFITFTLESNKLTRQKFPFEFRFDILYSLEKTKLNVAYRVQNTGSCELYFSVGGHPAFKVPLAAGTDYNDYYLEFNEPEVAGRWPVSEDGLIKANPVPLLNSTKKLPLTKELFYQDALVFKHLQSTKVSLCSDKTSNGLEFDFTGFPYLGIWAAKNADFICIEPWCGIADSISTNQQLTDKEGINRLAPMETFQRVWAVKTF